MKYIKREFEDSLESFEKLFKVILITGARQVGKSTLIKNVRPNIKYVTLDDKVTILDIKEDSIRFLKTHGTPLIIDEIQYVPEIFRDIKFIVDQEHKKAQYYLTGSQKFNLMQNVSDSLAGRVGIVNLHGLSLREIYSNYFSKSFIPTEEFLKERKNSDLKDIPFNNIWKIIQKGSMPEIYQTKISDYDEIRRFYGSYINTYIERDVRNLTQVGDTLEFLKFMTALASRIGQLLNLDSIAKDIGISVVTAKRWLSILEASNMVYILQPYSNNLLKRTIKTPKVYFTDTGIAAYLTKNLTAETLEAGFMSGQFFENFVVMEIVKSYSNRGLRPDLYFYRDKEKREIDLIIPENGKIYPVEIKKTASPDKSMIANFDILPNRGEGALICLYDELRHLGEKDYIVPVKYI